MNIDVQDNTPPKILTDLELVNRQLLCVAHLCDAVKGLAESIAKTLPSVAINPAFGHFYIKRTGGWTAFFMEEVGDMLNGMDAVESDGCEQWRKTFEEAAARWKDLEAELNKRN